MSGCKLKQAAWPQLPTHLPSSDAPRPPAVGGDLLAALDAALLAAWEDDPLIEAFCHDEGLVGAVANLEFAIEVVRTAVGSVERRDPGDKATGEHE